MQASEEDLKLIRRHVLLQSAVDTSLREVKRIESEDKLYASFIIIKIVKGIGSRIWGRLQESRAQLRDRRIWVDSKGRVDGDIVTYRYACNGRQSVYPITVDSIRTGIHEIILQEWEFHHISVSSTS